MRITFLTTQINLRTGGGSNISPHLKACSMHKLGHETRMITLFPEKNAFIEKPPYAVIEIPTRFKNWLMLQIKIFFVLKKYENTCDVFVFEGEHFIWGAGLYRALKGKNPVAMHLNGPIFSIYEHGSTYNAEKLAKKSLKTKISFWLRTKFEKNIGLRWANHINTFSADSPLIKDWHEKFGFTAKIIVLPAFVDLEPFFQNNTDKRERSENKINLLYVGRLVKEKGVDTLLTAINELPGKENVVARIAGNGPEKNNLESETKELKLENNIIFYPWSDKKTISNLYHCADIFIHPARWAEPLGLTVIEAMASGLPVIVPEISGSSWAAGKGGLTFKNGNCGDLREKIEKLINNKKMRNDLAEKARKRAGQFDYRNSIEKLENILQNLILENKIKIN